MRNHLWLGHVFLILLFAEDLLCFFYQDYRRSEGLSSPMLHLIKNLCSGLVHIVFMWKVLLPHLTTFHIPAIFSKFHKPSAPDTSTILIKPTISFILFSVYLSLVTQLAVIERIHVYMSNTDNKMIVSFQGYFNSIIKWSSNFFV